MRPRLPLPDADDVPVVVAARLSLSFPLLVSAVPLWAFDRTLSDPKPERCWFSDGGVSSNFPVHFFDAPLPQRPTFGIDLDGFHPDHPWQPDEAGTCGFPVSQRRRYSELASLPPGEGVGVLDFANGLVRTMQNHADTALAHQPALPRAHRPRPPPAERGRPQPRHAAGGRPRPHATWARSRTLARARIRVRAPSSAWTGHRWVRYRAAIAALAEFAASFDTAWDAEPVGEPSYRRLVERAAGQPPPEYPLDAAERTVALAVSDRLASAGEAARSARPVELGGPGSPQPEPGRASSRAARRLTLDALGLDRLGACGLQCVADERHRYAVAARTCRSAGRTRPSVRGPLRRRPARPSCG